jgi:hypothetical protein
MGSGEAILWLVALTTAIMLAVYAAAALRRAAARRARQRRYRQAAQESRRQKRVTQPGALSPAMGPELAAAVRRDAEKWAREVATGRAAEPRNPHPQGSQAFVLWLTSYHLTLAELSEQEVAQNAAACPPAQPWPGRS